MEDIIKCIHEPCLKEKGFTPYKSNKYNSMGQCYKIDPRIGQGYYWIYAQDNLFAIVIHDFYFYEDYLLECKLPEYLSITYYDSISGEELNPYKRFSAGCVKGYWSHNNAYQALFHKNIPIRLIGIEITPEYYENYLKQKYPGEYMSPRSALLSINEDTSFPELILLLNQLRSYKGTGMAAKLFYEGKVAEAISLIVEKSKLIKPKDIKRITKQDLEHIQTVTSYINDHYAYDLHLKKLSQIACMGTTKLKSTFKEIHKCTITEYIQNRRMGQAEHLLSNTDLSIGQVANIVGYHSASRFSELFKKSTGLLPRKYREFTLGKTN
ncbi:AraC family transcriptional regulator [Vallitalea longa]|uniref:AraC family transcriptional regulator n=1 Tax=Vallitalea longa TaxID=2936439 RepID=A0A9W5Y822_9FIRM|nr:AraC family transcriptional regulator [Vallitalea longa]GKX27620.1 AraC family transcriptional regulator [Vallitalea longa]